MISTKFSAAINRPARISTNQNEDRKAVCDLARLEGCELSWGVLWSAIGDICVARKSKAEPQIKPAFLSKTGCLRCYDAGTGVGKKCGTVMQPPTPVPA